MELEMLEDWLNNPGPERELTEKRMTEQQVSQEETTKLKSVAEWKREATDEDEERGMGDHSDLPTCQKFSQLRTLQHQGQRLEQLDREIKEIRRLMLESAETASDERLSRKEEAAAAAAQ
jgi:hypothetical protein